SYQQQVLPKVTNEWILMASKDPHRGALPIHQDVNLYFLSLAENQIIGREIPLGRYGWLQLISGEIKWNGQTLAAGDGLALNQPMQIELLASKEAKLLFFDLN